MSEQQKTAGYKVVPVEPTPEMVWKAEEDSPPFYHGDPWYGSEPPSEGQINAIYKAMLEAAPQPPALTDARILEIAMSDDVSLIEDQGPGVRPRITVHNSIGGVYALARAVERELYAQKAYSYWPATPANATDDSGNTLLRVGEDEPMPASPARTIINDALKPCPEIDAVTREMADQAEIAYQVLSEALGLTPEQMSDLTLPDLAATASARLEEQLPPANAEILAAANRAMNERMDAVIDALRKAPVQLATVIENDKWLVTNVETIVAELISEQIKASEQRQTITGLKHMIAQIRATLDLPINASSMDILAEVENISRLADRAIQIGARDAANGPYIIISDPRGCAGIHETIDEARKLAEGIARRSTSGRSAIVSVVAEVDLVPQWSDAR